MVTDCGIDGQGLGFMSLTEQDFLVYSPSTSELRPTQPPNLWLPSVLPRDLSGFGVKLTGHLLLGPTLRIRRFIHSLTPYTFMFQCWLSARRNLSSLNRNQKYSIHFTRRLICSGHVNRCYWLFSWLSGGNHLCFRLVEGRSMFGPYAHFLWVHNFQQFVFNRSWSSRCECR
jgi:hypothetical protein